MGKYMTKKLLRLAMAALLLLAGGSATGDTDPRQASLAKLGDRSFQVKAAAVDELAATRDDTTRAILSALLEGDLYNNRRDDNTVIAEKSGSGFVARDALSGAPAGEFGRRDLQKITINNSLRTKLRSILATFDMDSADPARRLASVREVAASMSRDTAGQLRARLGEEDDEDVRGAIAQALALFALDNGTPAERLEAVPLLEASVDPLVRSRLLAVAEATDDDALRERIALGVNRIDSKLAVYRFIETLFFGLSLGSVLVLAAIGLAITFGVMGVINMAHGELIMLGAYTTYVVQQWLPGQAGVALVLSIPLAFVVAGLTGIAIERCVIRFLYGRPLETLLATFGISLILQQAVRSIFSPLNRSVATPEWMSGSIQVNEALSLTANRLTIIVFCLVVFAVLSLVLKRTRLGLQVRAVSQNREMARAMRVPSSRVDALTFGLGAGIAGIAGVALSQLTNVGPNLGQSYIIDSFMVVVFGGVGNLWGTLVGGMSLGVLNKFLEPWAGAVLAKIIILVLLILFIQKRPRGLFPQRGRAAES